MRKIKTRRLLGSILILTSFLILSFTYYPLIKLYFLPPPEITDQSYSMSIPKINAFAPIITGVNPWQKDEYLKALSKGIAQANDNPSFFFAHSSDLPWRITRYNTAFLRLGELEKGDLIIINQLGVKKRYLVVNKVEVWPREVEYVKNTQPNQIVLMTCTPVGTSLKRLLVFADLST